MTCDVGGGGGGGGTEGFVDGADGWMGGGGGGGGADDKSDWTAVLVLVDTAVFDDTAVTAVVTETCGCCNTTCC